MDIYNRETIVFMLEDLSAANTALKASNTFQAGEMARLKSHIARLERKLEHFDAIQLNNKMRVLTNDMLVDEIEALQRELARAQDRWQHRELEWQIRFRVHLDTPRTYRERRHSL